MKTAETVWKSQQEPVQGVTVTTGLLGLAALHPSETDIQTMREILLIVLGDEGIEKTWGLSTIQANEAANRALSSRCPKMSNSLNQLQQGLAVQC